MGDGWRGDCVGNLNWISGGCDKWGRWGLVRRSRFGVV